MGRSTDRSGRARAAVGLAAALVGWSATAGLKIPARRHPLVQAGLAGALVALTDAPLGLRPPALWRGLRAGAAAAAACAVVVTCATASPRVRAAMTARELPERPATWLAFRIPLGTVFAEEAAYRAALGTLAADAFGPAGGRLLQAAAFGLSHVHDARATGEPVAGTVLATAAAGWLFGWLFERTGSLAAPMLAHLAINEAGAVAAILAQKRRR